MAKTHAELEAMLERLEKVTLPQLERERGPDDFMEAFAGEADIIEDSAEPDDAEWVRGRIDCMLASRGLIPGENEGEPCA